MPETPQFSPRRLLGATGFVAAQIGCGDVADRAVPLEQCVATVTRALEAGLNVVDTAPLYENGYSEEIVGQALAEWERAAGGKRQRLFIIDKIDHLDEPVAPQIDASLGRLGLEYTDAFVLHGLSTMDGWARAATEGGALRKLLALGLLPGVEVEVERRWPAVVVRIGFATVALDAGLAEGVVVGRE